MLFIDNYTHSDLKLVISNHKRLVKELRFSHREVYVKIRFFIKCVKFYVPWDGYDIHSD